LSFFNTLHVHGTQKVNRTLESVHFNLNAIPHLNTVRSDGVRWSTDIYSSTDHIRSMIVTSAGFARPIRSISESRGRYAGDSEGSRHCGRAERGACLVRLRQRAVPFRVTAVSPTSEHAPRAFAQPGSQSSELCLSVSKMGRRYNRERANGDFTDHPDNHPFYRSIGARDGPD
jgi:hypothetical protein